MTVSRRAVSRGGGNGRGCLGWFGIVSAVATVRIPNRDGSCGAPDRISEIKVEGEPEAEQFPSRVQFLFSRAPTRGVNENRLLCRLGYLPA